MRKYFLILALVGIAATTTGCFIFKKKEKYGCPTPVSNMGAEKVGDMDARILKKNKNKFKAQRKF